MKNTFGGSITATLFGESHGAAVGIVLDGLAPGIEVSEERIAEQLARRRPSSNLDTPRREPDNFQILSGVFNGRTTGTPLCVVIPNENTDSSAYSYGRARPSHADYAAYRKYHGCEDYRGGGHFSGRITAAIVAAGGILLPALENTGVKIGTHILRCAGVSDREFGCAAGDAVKDIEALRGLDLPVLDDAAAREIADCILRAKSDSDSVGGVTSTAVCGLPAGLGEPWFDSVESVLSHALFGIGGIKGIEFGAGFSMCGQRGSEVNDALRVENGEIIAETNNSGGINGGITNGMPVMFRCAVKPTPSIAKEQRTVDFLKNENADIRITGRHDPAIIRRVCPVIDSVTALVVCDLLAGRYGTDFLTNKKDAR